MVLAAQASEMSLIDFAFKTTLPISIAAIIGMAIAHFFWQRYLDKKEHISHEMLDVSEITTTAPAFYAILPFTPIIGVLIFDGKWGPQLHIITILVICMPVSYTHLDVYKRQTPANALHLLRVCIFSLSLAEMRCYALLRSPPN